MRSRPVRDRMPFRQWKRRDFITLLGGAAAWPLAARAQQPAIPVVGFVNASSSTESARFAGPFRQGLADTGYIEGQNVAIEYRWADSHYERLPDMIADLVRRRVAVLAATSTPAALAAKAATTDIPIVFETAGDPITLGLVGSLSRPTGNVTGVTQLSSELVSKRVGLLHDLIPTAKIIASLINQSDPRAESQSREMHEATRAVGVQLQVLNASNEAEID